MKNITVALDAEGGDRAPSIVIQGAALSSERKPNARFIFFGDENNIKRELDQHGSAALRARSETVHCLDKISMDEKPIQALRRGKQSSMWKMLSAVSDERAHAALSAGNTGALLAMSVFCLRTATTAARPALAALWPTLTTETVVLDVGANMEADYRHLTDFAVMGAEYARILYQTPRPKVGLLNVGTEAAKGNDLVRNADARIRAIQDAAKFEYLGFVEGDDICKGVADVIVTDGFSGNIALKTAEGTAKLIGSYLRGALTSSVSGKIGAFIAKNALTAFKNRIDPRRVNGGVFLGLNGLVVKSHGGTDGSGFSSALDLTIDLAAGGVTEAVRENLARLPNLESPPSSGEPEIKSNSAKNDSIASAYEEKSL